MSSSSPKWQLVRTAVVRNKGLVSLIAVGLVLLAAVIAFFHALWVRQNSSAVSIREDAVWATYQTDRETGRLLLAVHDFADGRPSGSLVEVMRRFDILYSRHDVMEEADFPGKFRSDPKLHALTEAFGKQMHDLAPLFDRFAAEKRAAPADLETAIEKVTALRSATEALLQATNQVQLAIQMEDREATSRIYAWLAGTVLALMVAVGAVIVMIWRQLKQNEISRFRLQRLSEELGRSVEAAEAGNKAKSAFLATMSHEIRTPLNGIIGTAELMQTGRLDAEQIDQLSTIRQCSDALIALINDILDFSKLESGTIDLERRPTDLAEVIDGVVEMLSPKAEAKGLDLVASYPLSAYETDPTRLRQVLINLVGNAVKFTDYGSVVVRAREIVTLDGAKRLRIEVEDTGVGIAASAVGRLFTEFSQADASIGRRFGGTGLGLAISKRIVEAMQGRIGVESVEGRGTTFWIEVPVGVVETVGVADVPPGAGLKGVPSAASPLVRTALARDLRALGVEIVPSWRKDVPVDLVVVDHAGWEASQTAAEPIDPVAAVVFGFGTRALAGKVSAVVDGAMTTRRLARILTHRMNGTAPSSSFDAARPRGAETRLAGRVLVVEDNPVNRKVAVGILNRMGLSTETVVDGLQAVERLAKGGIDLVLMDMQMPVMDGLEATRRIRADGGVSASVPIVGLTANAFASDRAACFEAGMDDFVMKPVTRDRLQAALAVHLPEIDEVDPRTGASTASAAAVARGEEAGAASPVLDLSHRRHLAEQIGDEGVAELTEVFVADAAALLEELAGAYAAADRDGVRRVLHTLTGAASNVGCAGVVAVIAAIREAGVLECPDLVGRLGAAVLAAREALEAEAAASAQTALRVA
jgi:signal transduction histidine kinase/CheY-like chemotaxis protein/HPt (histidine-containing phosphotransfer) domain-containing protein